MPHLNFSASSASVRCVCREGPEEASIHRRHGLYIATCRWCFQPMDGAAGLASSFFFSPPLRAHRRLLRCGRWWVWWTSSQLPIPILRGRGGRGSRTLHGQLRRTAPRAGRRPHGGVRSATAAWHAACLFLVQLDQFANAGWLMDRSLLTRHVYRT